GRVRGEAHGLPRGSDPLPGRGRRPRPLRRRGRGQRHRLHAHGLALLRGRRHRAELLARVRQALAAAGFWERFETDWVSLDCELMPWSAKAQELPRQQYAAVGSASRAALAEAVAALEQAAGRGGVDELLARFRARAAAASRYVEAYRRYCWPV